MVYKRSLDQGSSMTSLIGGVLLAIVGIILVFGGNIDTRPILAGVCLILAGHLLGGNHD